MNGQCRDCGEDFVGDGYSVPFYCPNSEDISGIEPDANPVNCGDTAAIEYEQSEALTRMFRAVQAHED